MTGPFQSAPTDATRALALAMFDDVPCFFSTMEPPCPHTAAWIVHFRHLSAVECSGQPPFPLCPDHKRVMQQAVHPFWRAWLNTDPIICDDCGAEVTVDRFEAI